MKKLKKVGFFSELEYGDEKDPSLKKSVNKLNYDCDLIIEHLNKGVALVVSPGLSYDVLSEDREVIGTLSIKTDGEWAWPSDLLHYLSRYKVDIPNEFINHIERYKDSFQNIDTSKIEL